MFLLNALTIVLDRWAASNECIIFGMLALLCLYLSKSSVGSFLFTAYVRIKYIYQI